MSTNPPPNPPPGSNDPTGNPFPPKQSPPTPALEKTQPPAACPECGSTEKPSKHCHHFWHDVLDGLGNAIGEAKFGE